MTKLPIFRFSLKSKISVIYYRSDKEEQITLTYQITTEYGTLNKQRKKKDEVMKMKESRMFKIVAGVVKSIKNQEEGTKEYEFTYNCKKPLFASNDFQKAVNMWNRICDENNHVAMAFIMDLGLQTKKLHFLNKISGCCYNKNTYKDVEPYFMIDEYFYGESWGGIYSAIYVEDGIRGGEFKGNETYEAIRRFMIDIENYRRCKLEVERCGYTENGLRFRRVRTVATSYLLEKQTEVRQCSTIKTYKAIHKGVTDISELKKDESSELVESAEQEVVNV